jgi:hypothetical protein
MGVNTHPHLGDFPHPQGLFPHPPRSEGKPGRRAARAAIHSENRIKTQGRERHDHRLARPLLFLN